MAPKSCGRRDNAPTPDDNNNTGHSTNLPPKEIEADRLGIYYVVPPGGGRGAWHNATNETLRPVSRSDAVMIVRTHGGSGEDAVLSEALRKPIRRVSEPFQPVWLSGRRWNSKAARLRFQPAAGDCSTWKKILNHVGEGLDLAVREDLWCRKHGIKTGGAYLALWVAAMLQDPRCRLPYLFLYASEQDAGKSTFHEALATLFDGTGVARAVNALNSPQGFNGELEGTVLAVVEEARLKPDALTRLKDWVTGRWFTVHGKRRDPYDARNYTHWVHTTNDPSDVPVLPGDTRVVMVRVQKPERPIPKPELFKALEQEAPAFLHWTLNLAVPPADGRLRVPVVESAEKKAAADAGESDLSRLLRQGNTRALSADELRKQPGFSRFSRQQIASAQQALESKSAAECNRSRLAKAVRRLLERPPHRWEGSAKELGEALGGPYSSWEAAKLGKTLGEVVDDLSAAGIEASQVRDAEGRRWVMTATTRHGG